MSSLPEKPPPTPPKCEGSMLLNRKSPLGEVWSGPKGIVPLQCTFPILFT